VASITEDPRFPQPAGEASHLMDRRQSDGYGTSPKWAVPGIVAEGVNLLAGPPKVEKSWLSLGLGLSVASGTKAFDAITVPGCPVLYLALEDTPRRLQTRMGRILG
jgi:RecA-family ATPase